MNETYNSRPIIGYRAVYKCKWCGEFYTQGELVDKTKAESDTTKLASGKRVKGIKLHRLHNCNDGSFGISDFVGYIVKSK